MQSLSSSITLRFQEVPILFQDETNRFCCKTKTNKQKKELMNFILVSLVCYTQQLVNSVSINLSFPLIFIED